MAINPAPVIVLVATQMGENIGMCARAMLNCGLSRLRLVAPRDGWPNTAATATAADADVVLENAEVFESVEEAVADCQRVFATTARERATNLPVVTAEASALEISTVSSAGQQTAILFGPEASGLDADSLLSVDTLIHIGTNPEFSSLNLAQAVLLVGWEWRKSQGKTNPAFQEQKPAGKGDLDKFLDRLDSELEEQDFFLTPELKPTTVRNLHALFQRITPTTKELKMLHGVLTALTKRDSPDQTVSNR